ncbi:hypothetical protein GIB67_016359 [Kingdonia uniflora]|uniref:Protein kinase domain-containing protein n=1 Tax=Kingdonia uniflora TaxID=39325 RepID=A0A7J7M9I3_9MAGN|nr:hypothetical protein GIB67_016359 [Kingdonia uniflora]
MLQYYIFVAILHLSLSVSAMETSLPLSPAPDALALLAFKLKADLDKKLVFELNKRFDYCHWEGVKCAQGKVVRFVIEGFGLGGIFEYDSLSRLDQLKTLSLQNNSLMGPIPDLSRLVNLKTLFLNHNSFTGSFPPSIVSLHSIQTLDLSHNVLTGPIPVGLTSLDQIYYLRLEFNFFNGSIPLLNQSLLMIFNVSSNNLTGDVPITVALSRFRMSSFLWNPSLCGAILNKSCLKPSEAPQLQASTTLSLPQEHSVKKHDNSAIILGLSLTVLVLILSVVLIALNKRTKQKKVSSSTPMVTSDHQIGPIVENKVQVVGKSGCLVFSGRETQIYSLEQLMRSSAEMLGRGSNGTTYKAVLDNNVTVTVKRIDARGNNTITSKEMFERHMEFVGRLRHPNLVPLRAYFHAKEERLLIYDYYSNGSLFSLIHGSKSARAKPLHWTSCLKIAEDIAEGLVYIHQTTCLIHGNLKSSNVLLGPEFEACLADYSLSGPTTQEDMNYTTFSDIYAFGILLLEILTSKPASPQPFLVPMDLLNWVRYTREGEDSNGPNGDDNWLVMLVEIVSACVRVTPKERLNAMQILKMIQDIKEVVTIDSTCVSP